MTNKLTKVELKELMDFHRASQDTPVIALSVADGLAGKDFASRAHERFTNKWIALCKKRNLNPDECGFNSKTGEIITR